MDSTIWSCEREAHPTALIGEIRAAIRAENPNLAIGGAMTLADVVDRSLAEEKLLADLAGFFGVLALLLSSMGLYGVISYSVSSRTHEIGIRMALGALPKRVLGQVLRESLVLVALGLGGWCTRGLGLRAHCFKPALRCEGG